MVKASIVRGEVLKAQLVIFEHGAQPSADVRLRGVVDGVALPLPRHLPITGDLGLEVAGQVICLASDQRDRLCRLHHDQLMIGLLGVGDKNVNGVLVDSWGCGRLRICTEQM